MYEPLMQDAPGIQTSYAMLTFTWLSVRLLHLWLRYQSLSVLRFRTINFKRAQVLVKSHILQHTVPGYVDCNKQETILSWGRFLQPQVTFGVSMEKMIGRGGSSGMVKTLVKLYKKQRYILFVNQRGAGAAEFFVTFKVGATSLSVLKSLWHAHWLHEHPKEEADNVSSWLEKSLAKLEQGFHEFIEEFERSGWEKNKIILNVPRDILFHEVESYDCPVDE